jgi:hypothetical protein
VLIHIDAVEDLLFYHHPREELFKDVKVPWKEFRWQYGRMDGELDEDELHPLQGIVGRSQEFSTGDDDGDQQRSKFRGFISRFSSCMEDRGRSRERYSQRGGDRGGGNGEPYRGRTRRFKEASVPPSRESSDEERRAMRRLWQDKGDNKGKQEKTINNKSQNERLGILHPSQRSTELKIIESPMTHSDAIDIVPPRVIIVPCRRGSEGPRGWTQTQDAASTQNPLGYESGRAQLASRWCRRGGSHTRR